jgi:hypothetical protein
MCAYARGVAAGSARRKGATCEMGKRVGERRERGALLHESFFNLLVALVDNLVSDLRAKSETESVTTRIPLLFK